jgi:hypothetical protein
MRRHVYRGSLLSTYLVLWFAVSMVGIVTQLLAWDAMTAGTPPDVLLALRVAIFVRPFCIAAVWYWSRTGVIALILLTGLLVVLVSTEGFLIGAVGIIAPALLIVLVRPIWKFMHWGLARRSKVVRDGDEE